jgi:hypothetical protein
LFARAMVHSIDDRSKALADLGAEIVVGDLQEIDTVTQTMEAMDAAYCLVALQNGRAMSVRRARSFPTIRLSMVCGPHGATSNADATTGRWCWRD